LRICINRKPVEGPWGGGNLFVQAFCEFFRSLGHEVLYQLDDSLDMIFMQDPRYSDLGISINEIIEYKRRNPRTKIIHRVNECDARKGTSDVDNLLRECSKYTDMTIFVSNWMMKYHLSKGWCCKNYGVVINGVNHEHFRPAEKIENGKINLVTHHWSNNTMKGFDIYNAVDEFVGENDDYTFTYIGRDQGKFKNTTTISPIFGKELGKTLGKFDVYISGSRFDPGPNHILESLACQIPTYVHHDGGGAVEFAGSDHAFISTSHLSDILQAQKFSVNSMETLGWKECIEQYQKVIQEIFL